MHFNFNQAQNGFGNKLSAQQSTSQILMIRPARFGFNSETAGSNSFQENLGEETSQVQSRALAEFDAMVEKLRSKGVKVLVADDTDLPIKPDAIFPNNYWNTSINIFNSVFAIQKSGTWKYFFFIF